MVTPIEIRENAVELIFASLGELLPLGPPKVREPNGCCCEASILAAVFSVPLGERIAVQLAWEQEPSSLSD